MVIVSKKSYSTKDFTSCPRAKEARAKKRERSRVTARVVFQNGFNKIGHFQAIAIDVHESLGQVCKNTDLKMFQMEA